MGIVERNLSKWNLWRKHILIFVTVGSQQYQFDRLIRELDKLVENQIIKEKIFAQIGHSNYIPKTFDFVKFLDKEEYQRNISQCDILITHGGVGTIVSALKYGKKVMVVPRRQKYKEHIDDHQMQIAEVLLEQKLIQVVHDINGLGKSYTEILNGKEFKKYEAKSQVLDIIVNFIE